MLKAFPTLFKKIKLVNEIMNQNEVNHKYQIRYINLIMLIYFLNTFNCFNVW